MAGSTQDPRPQQPPDPPAVHDFPALLARIAILEARVGELHNELHARRPRPSAPSPAESSAIAELSSPAHTNTPPFCPAPALTPTLATPPETSNAITEDPREAPTHTPHLRHTASRPASTNLEAMVGGRWFAVAGGLALVAALGLFLKLAVDEGWLGAVPPAWRCVTGSLLGILLLGAGERERTHNRRWTSAGLSGAGIAAIYLSVLAAYGMYALLSAGIGFTLLAAVSALGVLLAARAGMASLAGVAYTGALLAPILVRAQSDNPLVWPAYLLALLASAQALSVWKGRGFVLVGASVWAACSLFGALWLLAFTPRPSPAIGFGFLAADWSIVQAAGILSILRPRPIPAKSWAWISPVALSITTGLGVAFLADQFARASNLQPLWLPQATLLFATLGMILAVVGTSGFMHAARLRLHTHTDRFIGALLVQAAAFALTTIVLATNPAAGAIVLALSAVAAAAAGRITHARGLEAYALVLLPAAVIQALLGFENHSTYTAGTLLLGLVPSTWMLVAVLISLSAFAVAWLYTAPPHRRTWPWALPAWCLWTLGTLMLMAGVLNASAQARSVQAAWIIIACALLAPRIFASRVPAVTSSLLALVGTAVLWCGKGVLFDKAFWVGDPSLLPILNGGLLLGLAIAVVLVFATRRVHLGSMIAPLWTAALLWTLLVTTLEVIRVAPAWTSDRTFITAAISIWWALFAAGLVASGFARRVPSLRHAGLLLMAISATKVVFIDLAGVAMGWRILSFVALGTLMLAVAGAYARLPRLMGEEMDEEMADHKGEPKP